MEKNNSIVNKITKTKEERSPDLAAQQAERQREFIVEKKNEKRKEVEDEKRLKKEREEAAKMRSYSYGSISPPVTISFVSLNLA